MMKWNLMGFSKTLSFFLLLLMVFVISGCSKKSIPDDAFRGESVLAEKRVRIQKHISDSAKQAQLLAIVDEGEKLLREFSQESSDYRERIQTLTADYDAGREDFEGAVSNFNDKAETLLKKLADQGVAMRELTTPEEWKKISKR